MGNGGGRQKRGRDGLPTRFIIRVGELGDLQEKGMIGWLDYVLT